MHVVIAGHSCKYACSLLATNFQALLTNLSSIASGQFTCNHVLIHALLTLQLEQRAGTVLPSLWEPPNRQHLLALLELERKACKW